MSLDICINLSDSDLKLFTASMKDAQEKSKHLEEVSIVGTARQLLADTGSKDLPDFIASRLKHVDTMITMIEDAGFALPAEDRANVLSALTYFASPDDIVPDSVPVLGFLDDAIMIELCVRELQHEIEAYREFRAWRDNEASRRHENATELMLTRVEWADVKRQETIDRMHRRRKEAYAGGSWSPVLFKVR